MIETNHTTSLPTIECVVLRAFWHGGRQLQANERVWLTQSDLAAHANSVRTVLTIRRREVEERIALVRDRI